MVSYLNNKQKLIRWVKYKTCELLTEYLLMISCDYLLVSKLEEDHD